MCSNVHVNSYPPKKNLATCGYFQKEWDLWERLKAVKLFSLCNPILVELFL